MLVKVFHHSGIRCFYQDASGLDNLRKKIQQVYKLKSDSFILFHNNADNEWEKIDNDKDLMNTIANLSKQMLKLKIISESSSKYKRVQKKS